MMNNHKSCETQATAAAKYCCGGELLSTDAKSNSVTAQLVPVTVTLESEVSCIHPCEDIPLKVTIKNRSGYVLPHPQLGLQLPNGVRICRDSFPCAGRLPDIKPQESASIPLLLKTDQSVGSSICIVAQLSFCVNESCCQAESEGLTVQVSRVMPALQITKRLSPEGCILSGRPVEVCLKVCNTGNVNLQEVKITDEIPQGMRYQPVSTRIAGGTAFDGNPADGILIDCLRPHTCTQITYCLTAL